MVENVGLRNNAVLDIGHHMANPGERQYIINHILATSLPIKRVYRLRYSAVIIINVRRNPLCCFSIESDVIRPNFIMAGFHTSRADDRSAYFKSSTK